MILGLTGGYCAGKNAVASLLEERGFGCIDLDRLGHQALAANAAQVEALLGPRARGADGGLDRRAIGALVFADTELLARYEAIVRPAMLHLLDEALAAGKAASAAGGRAGQELLCINAAILYKLPHARSCDAIIEVRAPLPLRLARSKARDGLGIAEALKRIYSQRTLWLAGRAFSKQRFLLSNIGRKESLGGKLDGILARIRDSVR